MREATLEAHRVRQTINTKHFAKDTNKDGKPRTGRPVEKWVLVTGVRKLEVYKAEKGGVIIEGSEGAAFKRAETASNRTQTRIRAIPFSSAFYTV